MLISLDTETTGTDFYHGCKPFFVSTCDELGETHIWEWDVDPLTRQPIIPLEHIKEIVKYLSGHQLIFHNAKFDIRALASIQIDIIDLVGWENIEDTLVLSHILNSGEPHGLKQLAITHLDILDDDQQELAIATKEARRKAKLAVNRAIRKWNIAKKDHIQLPSLKGEYWVVDSWLPKAIAIKEEYSIDHPWHTVLKTYGKLDPERTMSLYNYQQMVIGDLTDNEQVIFNTLYCMRMQVLRITYDMEARGITLHSVNTQKAKTVYKNLADAHETEAQILGSIKNVRSFPQLQIALYENLDAPVLRRTEKKEPSTDAQALIEITEYAQEHLNDSKNLTLREERTYKKLIKFITELTGYRKSLKASQYITEYRNMALQTRRGKNSQRTWTLHPRFNITGTHTTRFSSSNPNAQNISKQENYNLRKCFGPTPERYWLAADYNNIEMRIFAYCSGSEDLIEAFEEGKSFHMVIADILHPEETRRLGVKKFKKTENYRKVKNGNFSLIYGAGKKRADATYGVHGAYDLIRDTLTEVSSFMAAKAKEAETNGYITTLGGYRLQVPSDKSYAAVNYFVQGTAGWIMHDAMIRCADYLRKYHNHHIIMQVHDELVFDFPYALPYTASINAPDVPDEILIETLKSKMEAASESLLGVVVPVEVDIIRTHWGE